MRQVYSFIRFLTLGFLLAFALSLILPVPVSADDCTTDPLNAADCMRTPGFRQGITTILGVTATTGVVVTNLIAQNIVPGTPPSKPVIVKKPEPAVPGTQPPGDDLTPPQKPASDQPVTPDDQSSGQPNQPADQPADQPQPKAPPTDDGSIFTFDNFKRLVDYPNKLLQVLDKFKLTPDAIENWKKASRLWRYFPNKATADQYIEATKKRMNTTGKTGKFLDVGGKLLDAADAILKANDVIDKRGYTGWEKAGAYYVEGANKVFVTMLTKNPVVSIIDQIAGDLTGHNIESTIRAGEEKWHQVTDEYAKNIHNIDAIDAQIQTKDQGLRFIRRIKQQIADGKIPRDVGVKRARLIYDRMMR